MIEFREWPKIPRLSNEKEYFTEKIDGTNAAVIIDADGNIGAQSRSRLITPDKDNYGFASWVERNKEELLTMGEGHHYGEWWGLGIQRGYDQPKKIFSLFNAIRWNEQNPNLPKCCRVVPIIHTDSVEEAIKLLIQNGSICSPGYMRPEGVIVYKYLTKSHYKCIIDK